MKKNNTLLVGLLLGTWLTSAHGEEQNRQHQQIHPHTLMEYQNVEHGIENNDRLPPKPPRTMSPKLMEKVQKQHHLEHDKALKSRSDKVSLQMMRSVSSVEEADDVFVCNDPQQLLEVSGADLVTRIKNAELISCMYGLYNTDWVGGDMFTDQRLDTVVEAINLMLANYDATSEVESSELEKLVTYLRAMHWAESAANSGRIFSASYRATLENAFNAYFNGTHFVQFNGDSSRDFMVRYEMLILVNSSDTNRLAFLPRFSEALIGYANTVDRTDDWGVYYEENGVTQLLTHLFNAAEYQASEYAQVLVEQPEIISNLRAFVATDGQWLIGHTREYQWSDAVSELGRLLKFDDQIDLLVRPAIQNILASYSYDDIAGNGWINAQRMVVAYDSENCNLYGDVCNFDLQDVVLSGLHICSDTIKIRFQEPITPENLDNTCISLSNQEDRFHAEFGTNPGTTVADDLNEDLEVVVFSSYADYDNHAGDFFGISTNNGGMYLEGEPSAPDNQARFIAHQATWLEGFVIWNLEHEYIHYLDGRFNQWGSFSDQPVNSVWWGEGLAEYLSQPSDNANALTAAATGEYSLSELFQTTYSHDTERVYHWGYLAVRFMMENQRVEIDDELLPSMRAPKGVGNEGCQFDWQWKAKPEAEENGWYWQYDDSENGYTGSGYWVWTCGQTSPPGDDNVSEYTPYQDILANWNTRFDQQFSDWLACLVAGQGQCDDVATVPGDINGDQVVDMNDVRHFLTLLRNSEVLNPEHDFNQDGSVDHRDIRALMNLCDVARCAVVN